MKQKYIYATSILGKTIRCKISYVKEINYLLLQVQAKGLFRWKNQKTSYQINCCFLNKNKYETASKIKEEVSALFERYNTRLDSQLYFEGVFDKI